MEFCGDMPIEERCIRYVAKVDEAFDEEENKD